MKKYKNESTNTAVINKTYYLGVRLSIHSYDIFRSRRPNKRPAVTVFWHNTVNFFLETERAGELSLRIHRLKYRPVGNLSNNKSRVRPRKKLQTSKRHVTFTFNWRFGSSVYMVAQSWIDHFLVVRIASTTNMSLIASPTHCNQSNENWSNSHTSEYYQIIITFTSRKMFHLGKMTTGSFKQGNMTSIQYWSQNLPLHCDFMIRNWWKRRKQIILSQHSFKPISINAEKQAWRFCHHLDSNWFAEVNESWRVCRCLTKYSATWQTWLIMSI